MKIAVAAGSDHNDAVSEKHNSQNEVYVAGNSYQLFELLNQQRPEKVVLDFNLADLNFLRQLAQHYSGTLALYNVDVSNRTNIEEACRGMKLRYVRSAVDGIRS